MASPDRPFHDPRTGHSPEQEKHGATTARELKQRERRKREQRTRQDEPAPEPTPEREEKDAPDA